LRDGDRLRFTSSRAFGPELASAWWLCVDHLRVLDAELAACHDLLLAAGHPPLAVRSVADVADFTRLSESIRCEGWEPIDARVEVSDVVGLVRRLGGRQLYGDAGGVPLRELLANAADAVQARKALEPDQRGLIRIDVGADLE